MLNRAEERIEMTSVAIIQLRITTRRGDVSRGDISFALNCDLCEKAQSEKALKEARTNTAPGFFAFRVRIPCYFSLPACYFAVIFDRSAGFMGLSEVFASQPAPICRDLQGGSRELPQLSLHCAGGRKGRHLGPNLCLSARAPELFRRCRHVEMRARAARNRIGNRVHDRSDCGRGPGLACSLYAEGICRCRNQMELFPE